MFLFSPDLKRKGFFTASFQTPLTPGPPRKRQKLSHHKNNHQPYHTPRQSPHNHNQKPKGNHIFFNDNDDFEAATPKTKKFNKHKQQQGTSNVKPWKPKRPVPTSRDPLPPTKLIVDEAEDFPRGGGKAENKEKKRNKKKKMKQAPSAPPEGHRESRTVTGEMQGSASKQKKGNKNWRNKARKNADKKHSEQMYPTDENLFIIKQRKRSR